MAMRERVKGKMGNQLNTHRTMCEDGSLWRKNTQVGAIVPAKMFTRINEANPKCKSYPLILNYCFEEIF